MSDAEEERIQDERPAKRFKHQSYKQTLKEVHLTPAFAQTQIEYEVGENDSHFHEALQHWRELSLAPAFLSFSNRADGLSASMPLLVHHWKEILGLWFEAIDGADDEGLKPLLDLFQQLAHDLRKTIASLRNEILSKLLKLLPRSLLAETLSTLLDTFSALFKYVTIPSDDMSDVWSSFATVLPKCDPEVQRMVAELWGSTLRRMKTVAREHCVTRIAISASSDVGAWTFVSACKSVSQTLHTVAPTVLSALLYCYITSEDPDSIFPALRRVLTALVHHCKGADQFAPIADILVNELVKAPKEDNNALQRLLEVTVVACSVRQGSRLTEKQLHTLLSQFPSLPLSDRLHAALLKFVVACLVAGDMALWMGPGRKVFERLWEERPFLALELTGALSELNWGAWKLLALPHVLKRVPGILDKHPHKALEMFSSLQEKSRLETADAAWRQRLQTWVDGRFQEWNGGIDQVLELQHVIQLSDLLPGLSPVVVRITKLVLESAEPKNDYQDHITNSSWILGSCLRCLADRKASEWIPAVNQAEWTETIIRKWGWSGYVLEGLVSFTEASSAENRNIAFAVIYEPLKGSLLSYSRRLRLSALRVLCSQLNGLDAGPREVLKRCLLGEEVSVDVHGVRERVLHISRMNQILRDGDQLGADVAARWLIAQLKVNLRPLWMPCGEALATLSARFGDHIWQLVFSDLQNASSAETSEPVPEWMKETEEELDAIYEQERTWRDPSAHKLRSAVNRWLRGDMARLTLIKTQLVEERFDPTAYEIQLLATLAQCPALAEKHSRDLVPHFFTLAPPDAPTKLSRHRLNAWLTLYSKFINPKALNSTDDLQLTYTTLLSHPDRPTQRLALSCILTYKTPALVSRQDTLYALLDDTQWRDQLTQLEIAEIPVDERRDVVPVIVRMLFGLMLERHKRSHGADRRAAVMTALAGCTDDELCLLVDLMLGPINKDRDLPEALTYVPHPIATSVSDKQLVGFLNLLGDVLKNLGSRLLQRWPILLTTLLDVIGHAQGRIQGKTGEEQTEEDSLEEDLVPEDAEDEYSATRSTRTVRQLGLKRFADFFRVPVKFDFDPYMPEAFQSFISPRLPLLDVENTQAPSALLELFHVWSTDAHHARYLAIFDGSVLPKTYGCLVSSNVKPVVVTKVFDIIEDLLGISTVDQDFLDTVFKPHVTLLLGNFALLIERSKTTPVNDPLGRRQIAILSQLAPFITDSTQASTLLNLFLPILRKPSNVVPEKVKLDVLNIVGNLLPLVSDLYDAESATYSRLYSVLAYLYQNLRSRQARLALGSAFRALSNINPSLVRVADILDSLNAYSIKRLEEPDFDRRLSAFATLNETLHSSLSAQEWLPILYNVLNFIQDPDELTVRNNAALSMKRFIDLAVASDGDFGIVFSKSLYPGLKNGLRSKNEAVRGEILGVLSYAVTRCERDKTLQEMRGLLAGGDEEANFFNNILHVQVHRRTRALRRLAEYCEEGKLRSGILAEIFAPLVGNFITGDSSVDHHLVNEAITTTGRIAKHLQWGAYYALVQKYLRLSRNKDFAERLYVRTVVALLDNFHFPMTETVEFGDEQPVNEDGDVVDVEAPTPAEARKQSHIADVVNQKLLPALLDHLEKRKETDDNLRIPIAIGIAQVAMHLSPASRDTQVSKLLTVLSQVFRSKSQDTRDLARETLYKIAIVIGPTYLPLILRELRAALLRGPHLHVLSYVTHALLVHVTSADHVSTFSQLDDCVNDVAHISTEVIFGESGKDVQSEDFKTKMREVRSSSSKGLDSFAIIARYITPPKISSLLLPIRSILQHTETLKVLQQAEDLLRRIASGLNANKQLTPKELLVLCHTLISQNARFLNQVPKISRTNGRGKGRRDTIVELKRHMVETVDHYSNNSFRFVVFGLELFNTAYKRSRFDFQDPAIISRLEPMVTVIGNTLYSSHMQVVVPGLKAAAAIVKCPLKSIPKSLPVFIRQMIDIVKQTGSTESEVSQTALKSLATILRDQASAQVKEKDLVFLLELLSPDLEEPSRQAAVFAMLRAIVARKFVVPEIYDLMDKVAEIMVTNQSAQVQDLCRGVLLQFLLEYPQGKGRLRNQMAFLAKNLSYVHEGGRKSVMELLSAILAKFNPTLVKEYSDMLFVALVMVVANDDSPKCREMASELIKTLFSKLEDQQRRVVMSHVHSWAAQHSQPQLARVSSQIYSIIIDHLQADVVVYTASILEDTNGILTDASEELEAAVEDGMDLDMEWQVPYYALVALSKLLRVCPGITAETDKIAWPSVVSLLLFPHAWVRTASCRLLGLLFAAVPAAAPKADLPDDSLFSLAGIEDVTKKLCLQLRSENLDTTLSLQIVKNLFYVGKCFSFSQSALQQDEEADVEEEESDDEEDHDADVDADESGQRNQPLSWLFSKLSFQARSAHIARRNRSLSPDNWYHQPASVFQWFAAMASFLDATILERYLTHILSPVYRITDEDTIRDPHMEELKTLAVELQELVQSKVGTTKFSNVYSRIRQNVLGVRRERKTARVLQATTNPEVAANRKIHRNIAKKEGRKRKNTAFAESRGRIKRRRDE